MGYKLWDPKSRNIIHSNDVYLNEAKFYAKPKKVEEIKIIILSEDGPSTNECSKKATM